MSNNVEIKPGYARPGDSLKARTWFRLLSIEQRTILGIVFVLIVLLTAGFVGLTEQRRMEDYDKQYTARSIQRGAAIFDSTCSSCHGKRGEGVPGVGPTLNKPDEFNGTRLQELAFTGSLRDYFTLTVSAGRPARSDSAWPQPMPTWSQDYGGPLRPDQVQDVVNFVMNWGCGYDPEYDAICMGQDITYSLEGLPTPAPTPTLGPTPEPLSIADVIATLPKGDPARGEGIVKGEVTITGAPPCSACHSLDGSTLVGPTFQGIASKIPPAGYTVPDGVSDPAVYYLADSIYNPNVYKSQGFETGAMYAEFASKMSADHQDLADVIAYLLTLK